MNRHRIILIAGTILFSAGVVWSGSAMGGEAQSVWSDDGRHAVRADSIKVMTQNLYVGADLLRIVTASTPQQIPLAVAETLGIIQQANFPARATAIAAQINHAQPDVIGFDPHAVSRRFSPRECAARTRCTVRLP